MFGITVPSSSEIFSRSSRFIHSGKSIWFPLVCSLSDVCRFLSIPVAPNTHPVGTIPTSNLWRSWWRIPVKCTCSPGMQHSGHRPGDRGAGGSGVVPAINDPPVQYLHLHETPWVHQSPQDPCMHSPSGCSRDPGQLTTAAVVRKAMTAQDMLPASGGNAGGHRWYALVLRAEEMCGNQPWETRRSLLWKGDFRS